MSTQFYPVNKRFLTFGGLWNKKLVADFQNWMVVYHLKANLDEKNLFDKITRRLDPENKKCR